MASEDLLIHSRYENFINYMNETNQSDISAFENWIKKETQVMEKNTGNNLRSTKIQCVFCFKEVARQNISFHYDSCSGAQFFNYMRGGVLKSRQSCHICNKNFLKKHRNRHSCDVTKKDLYITCKYCGFNFLYHKKCRVHDIFLEYNRFNKIIEVYDDSEKEIPQKSYYMRKANMDKSERGRLDACPDVIDLNKDEVIIEHVSVDSKSCEVVSKQRDSKIICIGSQRLAEMKIGEKKDSLEMENIECRDKLNEKIIRNREPNVILGLIPEYEHDKIPNQIDDFKNETKEKITKCKLNQKMLKIAKTEIKIMLNLKKWFDLMRRNAVNNESIESYREELNNINLVTSNLCIKNKTAATLDIPEEKLLNRKRTNSSE